MQKELFVCSNFQQFKRIEIFIRRYKIKYPVVILLYTKAYLGQLDLVKGYIDNETIALDVSYLKIPVKPNSMTNQKLKCMVKIYSELLINSKPGKLYLQSFESHYALLANIAKKQGVSICLIEEGTGSYKFLVNDFLPENYDARKEIKGIIKSTIEPNLILQGASHVIKFFVLFIRDLLSLPKVISKLAYRLYNSNTVQLRLIKKSPYYPYIQSYFKNFDEIYAAFPGLLEKIFESKRSYVFYPYSIENQNSIELGQLDLDISHEDVIFASQRYPVDDYMYVEAIIDILLTLVNNTSRRVIIKLHPKDFERIENVYKTIIIQRNLNSSFVIFAQKDIMLEEIINQFNPYAVISIASTSLIYSGLNKEKIKSISIADALIQKLKYNKVPDKHLKLIYSHKKILNVFNHIIRYDGYSMIDDIE